MKTQDAQLPLSFRQTWKGFVFVPCNMGPHHLPQLSASLPFVPVLEPKGREQGSPHCQPRRAQACCPLSPPAAPPRLQLVAGPRGLRCAGVVEFYWGSRGGAISYKAQDKTQDLENRICEALQCGSFLKHLPEEDTARAQDPEESRPLPIRWKIQNTSCASLEQCFSKAQPHEGGQALAIVCSGE